MALGPRRVPRGTGCCPIWRLGAAGCCDILDVLEDLKEKAEGQLSDLRKAETNTRHDFEMRRQSLKDQPALRRARRGHHRRAGGPLDQGA